MVITWLLICFYTRIGLFSSVLSYVLKISKLDTLSLMCAREDNEKTKRQAAIIRQRSALSELEDHSENATIEAVSIECFKFLKALAKDFFEVQER